MLLKQQTDNTLDASVGPHVLRVVEMRPSGVAVLEGSDAARIEEQIKNIAHNPLHILDHNTYLGRFYWGLSLWHTEACKQDGAVPQLQPRILRVVLGQAVANGARWCMDVSETFRYASAQHTTVHGDILI